MINDNNATGITIRRLAPADESAVESLAQRDSQPVPRGEMIGAEVEGILLAATEIATGATVADPFSRTAELRGLLEMRARQLARREQTEGSSSRRVQASLAGTPDAGGRLLRLPARLT